MSSWRMSRPSYHAKGPRSGPLETSSPRRHHGADRQTAPTPERTMSPVRHNNRALVRGAAIREHYSSIKSTELCNFLLKIEILY